MNSNENVRQRCQKCNGVIGLRKHFNTCVMDLLVQDINNKMVKVQNNLLTRSVSILVDETKSEDRKQLLVVELFTKAIRSLMEFNTVIYESWEEQ